MTSAVKLIWHPVTGSLTVITALYEVVTVYPVMVILCPLFDIKKDDLKKKFSIGNNEEIIIRKMYKIESSENVSTFLVNGIIIRCSKSFTFKK